MIQQPMSVFEKLQKFVKETFKTTLEIFLEALKLSPNAQGYVSGSITELLLILGNSAITHKCMLYLPQKCNP